MTDDPIQRLILELSRLPGVGERSAARLAFYVLKESRGQSPSLAEDLSTAFHDVASKVRLCERCQNFAAASLCSICSDDRRDQRCLCVVEGVADLRAIERTGLFRGRYHVLHGVLAPLDGIGPEELRLDLLSARIGQEKPQELILATNANVEGDATALYLSQIFQSSEISVTRLATGVPMGGELEYLDQATLGRALEQRRAL